MRITLIRALSGLLVGLPSLYFCAALIGAQLPRDTPSFATDDAEVEVLLLAGPIHYDLLLPITDTTRARFDFARRAVPDLDHRNARWVIFGWGSRAFYTSAGSYWDLRPATIWRAVTGDRAVARIDVAGRLPPDIEVTRITLGHSAYNALLDALLKGVSPQALPGRGLSQRDAFFPTEGRFNLFHTCNQWLGARLSEAGVPTGRFTPTTWSLRWSLDGS